MKQKLLTLSILLLGVLFGSFSVSYGASTFLVQQGGTGTTTAPLGQLIYGGGSTTNIDGRAYMSTPTTTASCSGSASCTSFTIIGSSPVTISASGGGGGAGTNATSTEPMMAKYFVATSTAIASQFPYASSTAISVTGGATFGTSVGTKVGIGTAAPVRSLNVNGKALFGTASDPQPGGSTHQVDIVASGTDSPLMMTGGSGAMEIWNAVAVTRAASFGMAVPGTAITDDLIFSTFNGVGWNENLRIQTSSGNVGIGTPTPNAKLSITQGSSFTNIGELNGSSIYSGIAFGAASAALTVGNYSLLGNGTDTLINRPTGGSLFFRENNTNQMVILPTSGNVGIGNIAPASLLDVGTYNTSFYTMRTGDFVTQPYGHNNGFIADNGYYNGAAFTRITTGYSSGFQFYNGQLLVNTADTGTGTFVTTIPFKATFSDSGSIGLGGNIDPTVGSYSGAKMVILGTGNVGIGSTTPGTLLSLGDTGANTINISATATSTFGSGINLRTGCFAINGVCVGGGSGGSGTVTSITLGGGLDGASPLTTTGTITAQVGTSTVPSLGGLAYWTGVGTPSTLGTVATSSETCSTGVTCAAHTVLSGGGAITLASMAAGVLGTSITGVPTSQATSTLYGNGIAGQVLGYTNGGIGWVSTSTSSGTASLISLAYATSTGSTPAQATFSVVAGDKVVWWTSVQLISTNCNGANYIQVNANLKQSTYAASTTLAYGMGGYNQVAGSTLCSGYASGYYVATTTETINVEAQPAGIATSVDLTTLTAQKISSVSGGGSTSPGGSTSQLQYNGSGSIFAGVSTSTASLGIGLSGSLVTVGSGQSLSLATSSLFSGTTGQLPYFSGTNTLTGTSSIFIATNGKVGFGSTSPNAAFTLTAASTTAGTVQTAYAGVVHIIAGFENTVLKLFQTIDQWGHQITGGDAPTLSSCGTSPSFVGAANDNTMSIQVGSVAATGCTATFAHPWPSAPTCNVTNRSMSITNALAYSITTSLITVTQTGLTGAIIDITCTGTN